MRYLVSTLVVLFLSSCTNDFEVVIPAKPTTFVYCVLNASDPVHYLRINESFITFDDVFNYVKRSDSLYYEDLDLAIELSDSGVGICGDQFYQPKKWQRYFFSQIFYKAYRNDIGC